MTDDDLPSGGSGSPGNRPKGGVGGTTIETDKQLSLEVIQRVADAADVSPLELPPLYETIDGDALDTLIPDDAEANTVWPTVSFAYAGHLVHVDADGVVTVSATESTDGGLVDDEWSHVSSVDVSEEYNVTMQVVLGLANRADRDPAAVRSAVEEVVDLSALAHLSRPRVNGILRPGASIRFSVLGYDVDVAPDGTVAVGSTLRRLKRTGGNVLVVGDVPDALVDATSARLLGERGRRHLFALLDRDVHVVSNRLPPAEAANATVLNRATTSRSTMASNSTEASQEPDVPDATGADMDPDMDTTSAPSNSTLEQRLTVTDVTGGLEALTVAIDAALDDLTISNAPLEPGEFRFCVDSLRPLLEEHELDDVETFLESICGSVTESSVLAHYVLPVARSDRSVRAIEPLFDATVELRVDGTRSEQRWHIHESQYTTDWFVIERT